MSLVSEVVVSAVKRDESIRIKDIRANGFIPAVIYARGSESIAIQMEYQEFRKAFRITGTSTVMDVELDGKKIPTLVHDIQWHPVSGEYQHIDFYELQEGTPVKTIIDIVIEGLCPAVKTKAAVLSTPVTQLEIRCLPRHLFHNVTLDVSHLENYHDTIKVSDIELNNDEKIEILTSQDIVLVTVNPPKGGASEDDEEKDTAEDEKTEADPK